MHDRRKSKSKLRILLLVETSGIYGRRIIEGISRYALENGNWILFLEDRGLQDKEPYWLRNVQCDGIITRTIYRNAASIIENLNIPFVELLGDGKNFKADIYCDPESLAKMAGEHFLERNLRHFAFITIGQVWWAREYAEYFQSYLGERGYECQISPFARIKNAPSLPMIFESQTEHALVRWLRHLPKPIGLLCPSDTQAVFLANLCQTCGIDIPNEIAILGIGDNNLLCKTATPLISSIFVDGQKTGYEAAKLLLKRIEGDTEPALPIKISPSFVVARQSTDFIAVSDPDISKAAQFIRDQVADRITVNDVANHVHLSARTLNRKFQEHFGSTPEQEILRVRMEWAKSLLRDTSLGVREISEKIGYSTPEYFIRAFRLSAGMTPKQYRQTLQSGQ